MAGRRKKPPKPYSDFPLTAHRNGQWCKKIKGRIYYFGTDADAALLKYLDTRESIQAGRPIENDNSDGCRLKDAVNSFLTAKQHRVHSGELSVFTFRDYQKTCARLIEHFGKTRRVSTLGPRDFEKFRASLADGLGPTSVGDFVRRSRIFFKFCYDTELIEKPIRYGQSFLEPSKRAIRKARQEHQQLHGLRMYEADQIRTMLKTANQPTHAAILLGINCAFGATDIACLPKNAVDLATGWIDFPRPKTSVARSIPLWTETIISLREAIITRPDPTDSADDGLCFITARGARYVRPSGKSRVDVIARNFDHLLTTHGYKRKGLGFYALRHTFETVAGGTRDQIAVDVIMGHVDGTMASHYRQRVEPERLVAVTNYVHDWLFADSDTDEQSTPDDAAST